MDAEPVNSFTFTWRDPAETTAAARRLSGREFLEALRAGTIAPPPFAALFDFRLVEIGKTSVVFAFAPQPFMYNGIGVVHGGVAAAVFDTVVGCAGMTVVPPGKVAITMDLHVRYFKPLTLASGTARAEGEIIHAGRTSVSAEGRLFDGSGRLCGHATSTLAIIDPR